ncbi:SLAIN motif-containing protein-like [Orbicella faveolata]|uniref:SLAIN motif-containing protein-like n=1 Tax=Orbicella faveolata TaxID=48498 RepID=UPI0009E58AE7|nr:SLAIN motif-containing protein-like [Orbicella faveolata]
MSAELRKSAGSDIKRLQEMVKRLEEQNAQLKNTDNRRTPNKGEDNMVKVKLNLDDVPLLDLNAMVEEDEDTWLYVSPKHPPSAEQKKISPYKYLKDSLDVPELNKVRGSLLAKLESIAAQEGEFVS